jgi:nucleoid-associated protein YgaU
MKPGTKILLAVLTLFMGAIVVYWGIFYPRGDDEALVVNDPVMNAQDSGPTPGEIEPGRPEADPALPAGGELAEGEAQGELRAANETPVLAREEPTLAPVEGGPDETAPGGTLVPVGTAPPASPPPGEDDASGAAAGSAPPTGQVAGSSGPVRPEPARDQPAAASAQPEPSPQRFTTYIVREGDTLSSIAESWFGKAARWDLIHRANPSLSNPDRLRPGQTLRLPAKDAQRDPARPREDGGTYTVRSGETLCSIAQALLGDEAHWRLIYEANRAAIGPNPDVINAGMKLTIPPRPRAGGGS